MTSNIGIYTYSASLGESITNVNYGFNFVNGGGIVIISTNNYNNYGGVFSFGGTNGSNVVQSSLSASTGTTLHSNNTSSANNPSIYMIITTGTGYGGGNIYFTIIGTEPSEVVNLNQWF